MNKNKKEKSENFSLLVWLNRKESEKTYYIKKCFYNDYNPMP